METTIALAALTSALTLVATEAIKGIASSAAKDLWKKVKSAFGWTADPPIDQLPVLMATRLDADPELTSKLLALVQSSLPSNETAAMVVSNITANKAVIASNINIGGDLRM
jgi:hypothetical protein